MLLAFDKIIDKETSYSAGEFSLKYLLILRHAKSSWKEPYRGDHDRVLNKRGKRDAPVIGELLREEDIVPDLIITSSAARAQNTAKAVANSSGFEGDLVVTGSLYHAGTGSFLEVLSSIDDKYERVMVVGHNPGMEELLEDLTGSYERMVTAALAYVSIPIKKWSEIQEDAAGTLLSIWRPRELGRY